MTIDDGPDVGTEAWRPLLRDGSLRSRFARDGFVVVDVGPTAALDRLRATAMDGYSGGTEGFHTTPDSADHRYRESVFERIGSLVDEIASPHLDRCRIFSSALLAKWPGEDSGVLTHQDWSVVDESRFRAVVIWVPLVDCSPYNGTIRVLPGSHRWVVAPRPTFAPPLHFSPPGWEIDPDELESLSLQVGQALLYDGALVHASPPNQSGELRLAIGGGFAPAEAPLLHYYCHPDGLLERFQIDESFFTSCEIGTRPPDLTAVSRGLYPVEHLSADEVRTRCGLVPRAVPTHRERLFRDDDVQRAFEREGWIMLDLLLPAELERLREEYRDLEHQIKDREDFAEGFHTTIFDSRPDYREAVHTALTDTIKTALDRTFLDCRAFFANFVTKVPGAGPLPLHLDWTFVDENTFSSATVWCPLWDVDEDCGALGVVPRSHHAVDFIRGVNFPDHESVHRGLGEALPAHRLVPVRAGQAIVTDHRLLHYSAPNTTGCPRVAAALAVAPSQAAVVHYHESHEGIRRHDVDPEFFFTYDPGEDPAAFAGVTGSTLIEPAVPAPHAWWWDGDAALIGLASAPVTAAPIAPAESAGTTDAPTTPRPGSGTQAPALKVRRLVGRGLRRAGLR